VVASHRGIADSEDQQDKAHHDVRERNTRAISEQHGDWRAAGHSGQRGRGGDHEERNREYPEAAMPQLLGVASSDVNGRLGWIRRWNRGSYYCVLEGCGLRTPRNSQSPPFAVDSTSSDSVGWAPTSLRMGFGPSTM
jgi:hypothetical protein